MTETAEPSRKDREKCGRTDDLHPDGVDYYPDFGKWLCLSCSQDLYDEAYEAKRRQV